MRRMPIPDRRIFHRKTMQSRGLRGIRPSFPGLSPCPGQVAYVLLTSAPVAGESVATLPLPLDLHVLSLSLAFILSQDQTLRCCIIVSSFAKRLNENATLDLSSSFLVPASNHQGESRILLPVVHRFKRFGIDGNNYNIVPCSLVLLVAANMSKNSILSYFLPRFGAKSGAKLQPFIILTKYFRNFFSSKLSTK